MRQHLVTAAIVAFWVTMNVLLWRAESGRGNQLESTVPVRAVVERMLNAADPSTLRLSHRGRDLGQLRWIPSVRETPAETNSVGPEGMVTAATGYHLDADLALVGDSPDSRWYVVGQFDLNLEHEWQDVAVRLIQRPTTWEIRAKRGEDAVNLSIEDGRATPFRRRFSFADLGELPTALGPMAPFLTSHLNPAGTNRPASAAPIEWKASDGQMPRGRHQIRVFRIQGRILGRFDLVAYVSRAGEILRVELPDHYVLNSVADLPSREPAP
jgi:hypothetical protein